MQPHATYKNVRGRTASWALSSWRCLLSTMDLLWPRGKERSAIWLADRVAGPQVPKETLWTGEALDLVGGGLGRGHEATIPRPPERQVPPRDSGFCFVSRTGRATVGARTPAVDTGTRRTHTWGTFLRAPRISLILISIQEIPGRPRKGLTDSNKGS